LDLIPKSSTESGVNLISIKFQLEDSKEKLFQSLAADGNSSKDLENILLEVKESTKNSFKELLPACTQALNEKVDDMNHRIDIVQQKIVDSSAVASRLNIKSYSDHLAPLEEQSLILLAPDKITITSFVQLEELLAQHERDEQTLGDFEQTMRHFETSHAGNQAQIDNIINLQKEIAAKKEQLEL